MTLKRSMQRMFAALTTLGPGMVVQSLLFPWRKDYLLARMYSRDHSGLDFWQAWRAVRSARRPAWDSLSWTFLGDLLSYSAEGRRVRLQCANAALELTILAEDLVRVRLSQSGEFPALFSYAVVRQDDEWPGAPYRIEDGEQALQVRTARLLVRIDRHPCRLAFLDSSGQVIQADAEGMGWCGTAVVASKVLQPGEHIYGLGQKAAGLDRRGGKFEMWNADPQGYGPGQDPLYLNVPFYLGLHGTQGYGLFFDNSYRSHFDLGASEPERLRFAAAGGEMRYYFLYGPDLRRVLERYTDLTGRQPLPPLWALGYQQSRWSYYPASQVREVARQFRARAIPCDAIHLDIHYMRGYRSFTWDRRRFPDPAGLVADLRAAGFKTVTVIDPAIKADRRYAACSSGLRADVFCKYPDGTLFSGPVWPGDACFPDFTADRARSWWAGLHRDLLTEAGVAGMWMEMNEPTILGAGAGETLPDTVPHDLDGRGGTHAEAHNVYALEMARATREGWETWRPEERAFIISRSGYAGLQRYAAHWTGDNESTWEHLRLTMPMVLGLGLSGVAFAGCDTGGFDGVADGELVVRWTQLSAFTPFFRNHTALWTPSQEPWAHGEPYESLNRAAIELRYRLLPYLYTAFWQCSERGLPMARPLSLEFQADPQTHTLDDEFLFGDSLLVAPVCTPGTVCRQVYLPNGPWFDFWTGLRYDGPVAMTVPASLPELPIFARGGTVVPMWPLRQYVGQRPVDVLTLNIFPGTGTSWLYEDDGHSLDYQRGVRRITRFNMRRGEGELRLDLDRQGSFRPTYSRCQVIVHGVEGRPSQVFVDGQPVAGWRHNVSKGMVELELADFRRLVLIS